MAYTSYNGWSGLVRKSRDTIFFGAIKSGDLPDKPNQCHGCGITRDKDNARDSATLRRIWPTTNGLYSQLCPSLF